MEDTAPIDSPEPSAAPPSSTSIGRDQVNVSQSPGAIQRADSVAQNFGQQHNVNTGGGTYTAIHYHGVSAPLPLAPAALAAAQAHLAALPLGTVPQVAALPPGSRMPLAPNPLFVGRSDELQTLARALVQGPSIAAIAAATGLGGIGKTQLASEFVHRYGQYFAGGVCWMSFASAGSVPAEIVVCGGPGGMNLPGFGTLPFDQQVECVQQAWQSALPRLLIFDNCEAEALLAQWQPPVDGRH